MKRIFYIFFSSFLFCVALLAFSGSAAEASKKYPKKAIVTSTVATPQVTVVQTELYLNKKLTKKWYNKLNDSGSTASAVSKYAVALVTYKQIGPMASTVFLAQDLMKMETKKVLKKAVKAKKGVRVTRVTSSGRGQYMSVGIGVVNIWDGKRKTIVSHYKNKYHKVHVKKKITN